MHNQTDAAKVLREAAQVYKVDVDAITAKVKQEFAAKEKAKANEEGQTQAANEGRQESGRLTTSQLATVARSQQDRLRIFVALPVYPPFIVAPEEHRGDILAHPTGSAALFGRPLIAREFDLVSR